MYRYRLRAREAMYEADFEAIAELEQYHYASEKEVVALWVCPRCGETLFANTKPLCECGGEARLKEIRGSTPASRFLILELVERLPFEPRILGYVRLDPPIPRMHRRVPGGVERNIRERIFPKDWFHPTFEGGKDWESALDRVHTAASRIARVVVHPDYRSEGLGALLVELALAWVKERAVPEGRREKHLVYTVAQMARYHPFFEKVGFRYLFDTASGRPVLAYPLTEEAEHYLD
ncbi:ABC transporter ATP-binding protein, partial [Thermus scotoductus]|uniref:GNAT family N-acetyltransferase n=1 Tax=Thermus scotoductus TaxID=37636 RepID=UPI000F7E49E4